MPPIDYSLNNRLLGNAAANIIEALGGNDIVYGRGGDDEIYGGRGNDRLYGQEGNDLLDGGRGEDAMNGGNGDDAYYVDNGNDRTIEARSTGGTDKVYVSVDWTLGAHFENLRLYRGADIGKGNALGNEIEGNNFDNRLYGRDGSDTLIGNDGDDFLFGQNGDDIIFGGSNDHVGLDGYFTGDDYLYRPEDDGADVIDGGSGSDTVAFRDITYSDYGSSEYHRAPDTTVDLRDQTVAYVGTRHSDDTLVSIENVAAAGGDDYIYGDDQDNVLDAGAGRNYVQGGDGDDTVIGGFGSDRFTDGDLSERLRGGDGDDVLISNGAAQTGGDNRGTFDWARDNLSGGDGDDKLVAGFGFMEMNGGDGADQFEFSNGLEGLVEFSHHYGWQGMQGSIADFNRGEGDKIVLEIIKDEYSFGFQGTPEWVGTREIEKEGDVGYRSETGDDGKTDTIITMRLIEEAERTIGADLTITLEDWDYTLRESDFAFV